VAKVKNEDKYNRVTTKLWDEPWDDSTRLLAAYLLTNHHRTSEGLHRLSKAEVCDELRWSLRKLRQPWQNLLDSGFIEYDDERQVVLLTRALQVQRTNPKQRVHAIRMLRQLPHTPLIDRLYDLACEYDPDLAQDMDEGLD